MEETPKGFTEREWLRVKWLAKWMKKESEKTDEEKLLRQAMHIVLAQDDLTLRCIIVIAEDELKRRKELREQWR